MNRKRTKPTRSRRSADRKTDATPSSVGPAAKDLPSSSAFPADPAVTALQPRAAAFWSRIHAHRNVLFPLFLVLAGAAVYANSLPGAFLFDDYDYLRNLRDPATGQPVPLGKLAASVSPRMLSRLTLGVNHSLGGLDTRGYHVFNVVVHLGAGLALYGLMRRTLQLPSLARRFADSADCLAFSTALLWIVHPLQTGAVTYIVQRCESLMGMFFLLTMYACLRGATATSGWRWFWYASSFVTYCLGLMSKEVMVTVVPVLWIYDRVFLAPHWSDVFRQRGWLYSAFLLPLGMATTVLIPSLVAGSNATIGFGIEDVTAWEYARTQPSVILYYLRLAALPHPQCLDYGWPPETRWLYVVVPGLLVIGLLAGSAWMLLRGRKLGFLGCAFFLILAPTSSILPFSDLCFEHRMYLPLACVLAAAVVGGSAGLQALTASKSRMVGAGLVICFSLLWSGLTITRNATYHNPLDMWMDVLHKTKHYRGSEVLAKSLNNTAKDMIEDGQLEAGILLLRQAVFLYPFMPEIQANLGRGLMERGNLQAAHEHAAKALELRPEVGAYQHLLGQIERKRGRLPDAEQHFRAALLGTPDDDTIHIDLAQCLADQKRIDEAVALFEEVLQRDPDAADARHRLATALAAAERFDEAASHSSDLARRAPKDPRPHVLMGLIALQRKDGSTALEHLQRALQQDPQQAATHCLVGHASRQTGDTVTAARSYERALSLEPRLADAHNGLGEILAEREPERARQHLEQALASRPGFVEARCNLADALARLGRHDEALHEYREVLRQRPGYAAAEEGAKRLGERPKDVGSGRATEQP